MNLTIYHNPRCSKSRQTLELLESRGISPQIVRYLDDPPAAATTLALARMLGVGVSELLRTGEDEYKAAAASLDLDNNEQLADFIQSHPKVLQRPIVVDEENGRAAIGRPPEQVLDLLP